MNCLNFKKILSSLAFVSILSFGTQAEDFPPTLKLDDKIFVQTGELTMSEFESSVTIPMRKNTTKKKSKPRAPSNSLIQNDDIVSDAITALSSCGVYSHNSYTFSGLGDNQYAFAMQYNSSCSGSHSISVTKTSGLGALLRIGLYYHDGTQWGLVGYGSSVTHYGSPGNYIIYLFNEGISTADGILSVNKPL